MRQARLVSTTRRVVGVLAALLAAWLVAPGGAWAGCIHPLSGMSSHGPAYLDMLATAGALADPADGSPAAPPPASPCAGLRCSSDPAPAPSPVTAATPRPLPWGILAARFAPADNGRVLLAAESAALHPTHGGPCPFHPPRG